MFGVVLAVLLSSGVGEIAMADSPEGYPARCGRQPGQRERYLCWLREYPYSQAFYSQHGYDFRRERNIPWAVRANYSLPISAAASTRRFDAQGEPGVISEEPQAAPLPAEPKASKANGLGATGSK